MFATLTDDVDLGENVAVTQHMTLFECKGEGGRRGKGNDCTTKK